MTNERLLIALRLAQSHIDWLWDRVEDTTRLRRGGSAQVHKLIARAIAEGEAERRKAERAALLFPTK